MIENIKKWIEALRSGNYKQVKGTLKGKMEDGSVGYCCIGVYEEVVKGRKIKTEHVNNIKDGGSSKWYSEFNRDITPILPSYDSDDFIHMNDEQGMDFNEIADEVERILEERESNKV